MSPKSNSVRRFPYGNCKLALIMRYAPCDRAPAMASASSGQPKHWPTQSSHWAVRLIRLSVSLGCPSRTVPLTGLSFSLGSPSHMSCYERWRCICFLVLQTASPLTQTHRHTRAITHTGLHHNLKMNCCISDSNLLHSIYSTRYVFPIIICRCFF
jgi:hypothetical protein